MRKKSKLGRRQKNMSLLPETIDKIDELSAQYKIARSRVVEIAIANLDKLEIVRI